MVRELVTENKVVIIHNGVSPEVGGLSFYLTFDVVKASIVVKVNPLIFSCDLCFWYVLFNSP